MMKKSFVLCILTFLTFTLLIACVYYGDRLIAEFRYTEKVETLTISEISTYDADRIGGIFLKFRYRDPQTGKAYSSPPLFSSEQSYQVGDPVTVVTRNGCPQSLLFYAIQNGKDSELPRNGQSMSVMTAA